jgi:hypothetical protein
MVLRAAVTLALLAATILAGEREHQLRLARLRLALAEEVLKHAEETVAEHRAALDSGRITDAEYREVLFARDEALAERDRLALDLEEVRASGREPRHEIAAPRVGEDDFVTSRLEVSLRIAERALREAERRAAEARRLAGTQAASRGHVLEAESEVEVARAEHEALTELRRIRRAFVAGELPEAGAERQAAIAELEAERKRAAIRSRTRAERVAQLQALFEVGRVTKAELHEAQVEAAEAKTEHEIASLELERLRGVPRGVTELVFRVETDRGDREEVLGVIEERLTRFGFEDVTLGAGAGDRFSVRVPAASRAKLDRVKALITTLGQVEFRITVEPGATKHHAHYWKLFADARSKGFHEKIASFIGPDDVQRDDRVRYPDGLRWYRVADEDKIAKSRWARDQAGHPQPWILCALDPYNITGNHLHNVHHARDQGGLGTGWAVYFQVQKLAQGLMARLTSWEEDKHMAIIVNGEVHSAPILQSTLSDSGQITGRYTEETAKMLAAILQAGPLEHAPELVSERTEGK